MRKRKRQWKAMGRVGRYRHYKKRGTSKRKLAKRSIRTVRIGKHGKLLRVGCPKGYWKRGRCRQGLKAFSMLVPAGRRRSRRNPVPWYKWLLAGYEPGGAVGTLRTDRGDYHIQRLNGEGENGDGEYIVQFEDVLGLTTFPWLRKNFVSLSSYGAMKKAINAHYDSLSERFRHYQMKRGLAKVPTGNNPAYYRSKLTRSYVDLSLERPMRMRIGERRLSKADKAYLEKYRKGEVGRFDYGMGRIRMRELDTKRMRLSRVSEGSLWKATKGDPDKIAAWMRKRGFGEYADKLLQWKAQGKLPQGNNPAFHLPTGAQKRGRNPRVFRKGQHVIFRKGNGPEREGWISRQTHSQKVIGGGREYIIVPNDRFGVPVWVNDGYGDSIRPLTGKNPRNSMPVWYKLYTGTEYGDAGQAFGPWIMRRATKLPMDLQEAWLAARRQMGSAKPLRIVRADDNKEIVG